MMKETGHGNPMEAHYYDNADMKRIFKVCDKTLLRWRKNHILPFSKFGGKCFYSKQLIEALAQERTAYLKYRTWNWDKK